LSSPSSTTSDPLSRDGSFGSTGGVGSVVGSSSFSERSLASVLTLSPLLTKEANFFTTKAGNLWKEGEVVRNWKMRWFVLSFHTVSYYEEKDGKLKGTIELKDYTYEKTTQIRNKCQIFELRHRNNGRSYFLHAENERERPAWAQAFRQNCDYLQVIKQRHDIEINYLVSKVTALGHELNEQRVRIEIDELARGKRESELRQQEAQLKEIPILKKRYSDLERDYGVTEREAKAKMNEWNKRDEDRLRKIAVLEETIKRQEEAITKLTNLPPPPSLIPQEKGPDPAIERLTAEKRALEEEKKKLLEKEIEMKKELQTLAGSNEASMKELATLKEQVKQLQKENGSQAEEIEKLKQERRTLIRAVKKYQKTKQDT